MFVLIKNASGFEISPMNIVGRLPLVSYKKLWSSLDHTVTDMEPLLFAEETVD